MPVSQLQWVFPRAPLGLSPVLYAAWAGHPRKVPGFAFAIFTYHQLSGEQDVPGDLK